MRYILMTWVFVALAVAAAPAAAMEFVVVSSTAEGLEPGQAIDGATEILLGEGTAVTLVGEDGSVVGIKGPYRGVPAPSGGTGGAPGSRDRGLFEILGDFLRSDPKEDSDVMVIRGASTEPEDPWVIDVTRPGDHCALAGPPARFWRPRTASADRLTLETAGGREVIMWWPIGKDTLAWPENVALEDGAAFSVKRATASNKHWMTTRLIPADLPTEPHMAAWMVENGCRPQARRLLEGLE